jgi:hypothetical protein
MVIWGIGKNSRSTSFQNVKISSWIYEDFRGDSLQGNKTAAEKVLQQTACD